MVVEMVCVSISAKVMSVTGIDDRRYWTWIPTEVSRVIAAAAKKSEQNNDVEKADNLLDSAKRDRLMPDLCVICLELIFFLLVICQICVPKMIPWDGSCNGLQHYAALGRDVFMRLAYLIGYGTDIERSSVNSASLNLLPWPKPVVWPSVPADASTEVLEKEKFFLDKLASSLGPRFYSNIFKCKQISETGAQQMLLDTQAVKTILLEVPSLGRQTTGAASYSKFVSREMSKAEALLKVHNIAYLLPLQIKALALLP